MNLIIDIGNTTAKVALFNGSEMVEVLTESNQSLDSLEALCSKYRIERGIVATVVDLNERILAELAALPRSEERRVGKECRSRWSPYH